MAPVNINTVLLEHLSIKQICYDTIILVVT